MGILDFFNRNPKLTIKEKDELDKFEREKYLAKRKKDIEEKYR